MYALEIHEGIATPTQCKQRQRVWEKNKNKKYNKIFVPQNKLLVGFQRWMIHVKTIERNKKQKQYFAVFKVFKLNEIWNANIFVAVGESIVAAKKHRMQ